MDETQILKALERRPLTIENLAHSLGCSVEEMRAIVLQLWCRGYIDTTHATSSSLNGVGHWFLSQILPMGKRKRGEDGLSNSKTYFLLTSKGHFRLHPVVSFNLSR